MRRGLLAAAAVLALCAAPRPAAAENWDHPGLVHVEKLGWLSPKEAEEKGCAEYRGRWVRKDALKQLKAWEAEDAKHTEWKDAYRFDSKHYRIVTNVPRFIVELEIIPFLDACYETYVDVFKRDFGVSSKAANKKTIRIHQGFADYSKNEADEDGPVPRDTQGFIAGGSELAVYYEDLDAGVFYGTVFHEGAHQFMAAVFPGAVFPAWLDEGMATYFEGCVYSRADEKIRVNFVPPDRLDDAIEQLRAAKEEPGRSLAEQLFMEVPFEKFESEHYALAWSFIHTLVNAEGGKNRPKFTKFLQEMNGSGTRAVPDVFKRATGLSLAEVTKGWRDFVLAQKVEPMPWFVSVAAGGDVKLPGGCDLRADDFVLSLDGTDVFDAAQFNQLWAARAADREAVLVLMRRVPAAGAAEFTETRVVVRIPPTPGLTLTGEDQVMRAFNLRE